MLRFVIVLLALFVTLITAADLDYILALKSPVTEKSYAEARKDVESAGGKVLYEFKAAFKAIQISLPSEHVSTFAEKSYVDFIEQDKSVHIS